MPPRGVNGPAVVCSWLTTAISPNPLVGPTAMASATESRIPSSDSQKSMPSFAGSNSEFATTFVESSLITWVGGVRSTPMTVFGSSELGAVTTQVAFAIRVIGRSSKKGLNSSTVPLTTHNSSNG